MSSHETITEVIDWISRAMVIISFARELLKWKKFLFRKGKQMMSKEENRNKARDILIVIINILLGFAVPVFFLWWQWQQPFSRLGLLLQIIAAYVLISNVLLWLIFAYTFRLTKDIKDTP